MPTENPSASVSIPASSDNPSIMTPQPKRLEQGKFNKEETIFLKTHLPAYRALCEQLGKQGTGPNGTGLVKGRKKDWILSEVFPEYVKRFSSNQDGGPQLHTLQTRILRWFANRSPHRNLGSTPSATTTSKRPLAHDAKENKSRKELPEKSEIFKNQEDIAGGVVMVLTGLIGWDWGQYGEVVFFVQGAFRNADNDLKSFDVSVGPNVNITNFSSMLPENEKILRGPFRGWAETALPEGSPTIVGDHKYVIDVEENGLPRLPIFDINQVAPNDARSMLKCYIELTWKFTLRQALVQDSVTVPWDSLDTVALRRKLLVNAESFSHVKTLDPTRMSPHDVYNVLELLSQGQDSGVRVLEFSMGDDFNYDAKPENDTASPRDVGVDSATGDLDNGISEPLDRSTQPPSGRTADSELRAMSLRDIGIDSTTTGAENDISKLPDPSSSQLHNSLLLPLSAPAATASPVVSPPSKSLPPLSDDVLAVAWLCGKQPT